MVDKAGGEGLDNCEVRNENCGFCSVYGEAFDATDVLLGDKEGGLYRLKVKSQSAKLWYCLW